MSAPQHDPEDISARHALKFVLELCALAALASWGATTGPVLANVVLGVGAPLLAALVWGRFAAPKSPHRLADGPRTVVETTVFATAAAALLAAGAGALAAIFLVLVIANTWVLSR